MKSHVKIKCCKNTIYLYANYVFKHLLQTNRKQNNCLQSRLKYRNNKLFNRDYAGMEIIPKPTSGQNFLIKPRISKKNTLWRCEEVKEDLNSTKLYNTFTLDRHSGPYFLYSLYFRYWFNEKHWKFNAVIICARVTISICLQTIEYFIRFCYNAKCTFLKPP